MAINNTSSAFITMMMVVLLTRSARTPAGKENRTIGRVKTTKVMVVCSCEAFSKAVPPGSMPVVADFIARKATIIFQALSLKAPKN